jgi:hypothetical protein
MPIRTETVLGYHGTTEQQARQILAEGFKPSANSYDWLGKGAYFFQREDLALSWASEKHKCDDGALRVIQADIHLYECLDLAHTPTRELYRQEHTQYVDTFGRAHAKRLRQKDRAHHLDCAVFQWWCSRLEDRGQHVRVIRCRFSSDEPLWEDPLGELPPAGVATITHTQLAVRDDRAILNPRLTPTSRSVPSG